MFFLADSATYASGLTKTTNRGKKRVRKIHETFASWKKNISFKFGAIHSGQFLFNWDWGGPFFGRNTTDYLTGKIQTPQNISSGLFSKFSAATVLPWGAC